jgi:hypothetical protein
MVPIVSVLFPGVLSGIWIYNSIWKESLLLGSNPLHLQINTTQTYNHRTKMRSLAWLLSLPLAAEAGEVLWSGFFNASATVADFDKCKRVRVSAVTIDQH